MAVPKWKAALEKRKALKDANDVKTFSIPDGKTTLRILPNPKNPDDLFYHDFGLHWVKSKTEKNAQGKDKIVGVALCVSKAYDEPCPYCEAVSEALGHVDDNAHSFSDEEVKLIEDAKSRHRVLINAAVRSSNGDYEVKLVELASTAFNALIDLIDEWGEDLVAPESGQDIVFQRSGAGINTKYTCMPAKSKGSDIGKDWTSQAIDLEAYVKSQIPKQDRAIAAFNGIGTLADMSLTSSLPALSAPSTASTTSAPSESKPAPKPQYKTDEKDSVLDADLDQLEAELDDVPDVDLDDDAPFETESKDVVDAEIVSESSSSDDDLMKELDDLDLDDI